MQIAQYITPDTVALKYWASPDYYYYYKIS